MTGCDSSSRHLGTGVLNEISDLQLHNSFLSFSIGGGWWVEAELSEKTCISYQDFDLVLSLSERSDLPASLDFSFRHRSASAGLSSILYFQDGMRWNRVLMKLSISRLFFSDNPCQWFHRVLDTFCVL